MTAAPRVFVAEPFAPGRVVDLPAAAARHVQVLRLQPGGAITVFNGSDGADWPAEIVSIGRSRVEVRLGVPVGNGRELAWAVTLALGVPANDRMDALVEKAGELGAAAIQPLVCERSVLRLSGERAQARRRHWRGVATAASEQCGRARVADVLPITPLGDWLAGLDADPPGARIVLSLEPVALHPQRAFDEGDAYHRDAHVVGVRDAAARDRRARIVVLSGPEGGLAPAEEEAAVGRGFVRVGLGPRVLRADTAPLAWLAWLGVRTSAAPGESR